MKKINEVNNPCIMGMWCGSRCLAWKFENSTEGHCGYDWCDSANGVFAGSDRVTGTRGGVSPVNVYYVMGFRPN